MKKKKKRKSPFKVSGNCPKGIHQLKKYLFKKIYGNLLRSCGIWAELLSLSPCRQLADRSGSRQTDQERGVRAPAAPNPRAGSLGGRPPASSPLPAPGDEATLLPPGLRHREAVPAVAGWPGGGVTTSAPGLPEDGDATPGEGSMKRSSSESRLGERRPVRKHQSVPRNDTQHDGVQAQDCPS